MRLIFSAHECNVIGSLFQNLSPRWFITLKKYDICRVIKKDINWKTHWSLENLSRSESKLTCIVGIASLRELKLSFIWSRRFLSSALWWARLSVDGWSPPEPCRPLHSKKYALGLIYHIQLIKVIKVTIKTLLFMQHNVYMPDIFTWPVHQ